MALRVPSFDDAVKEYEVESGDGFVVLTVPEWDCQPVAKVEALDKKLEAADLNVFQYDGMRLALKFYNPKHGKLIDGLKQRQLDMIFKDWYKDIIEAAEARGGKRSEAVEGAGEA